jgi:hypothetical protein
LFIKFILFELHFLQLNCDMPDIVIFFCHLNTPSRIHALFLVRVPRSLVLYVCFVDGCLSICTLSFGQCVVCSSSIYGFWLPLWYLLLLDGCLSFVFWPLCCLFFFDIWILITPLVSSNSSYQYRKLQSLYRVLMKVSRGQTHRRALCVLRW